MENLNYLFVRMLLISEKPNREWSVNTHSIPIVRACINALVSHTRKGLMTLHNVDLFLLNNLMQSWKEEQIVWKSALVGQDWNCQIINFNTVAQMANSNSIVVGV